LSCAWHAAAMRIRDRACVAVWLRRYVCSAALSMRHACNERLGGPMKHNSVHVRFHNPRWAVTVEHENIARSHHPTLQAAKDAATVLAKQSCAEMIVHDAEGKIVERQFFGVLPL